MYSSSYMVQLWPLLIFIVVPKHFPKTSHKNLEIGTERLINTMTSI